MVDMSVVRLSERGEKALVFALFTLVVSFMFRDVFLGLVCVFFLGLMFFQYRRFSGTLNDIESYVEVAPSVLEGNLVAGEELVVPISVESELDSELQFSVELGEFTGGPVQGAGSLDYRFSPVLSGKYLCESLMVSCLDEYGILQGRGDLGFGVEYNVYPRVYAMVMAALDYLGGYGLFDYGEGLSQLRGEGTEYAESREYLPGDNVKLIDWKASARTGKVIVRENYRESSGSIHIVYEAGFNDAVSGDVLASSFLEAVLSFAEADWGIGLTVLRGGEVVHHGVNLPGHVAVSDALGVVLSGEESVFRSLFTVLDPAPRSRLRTLLGVEFVGKDTGLAEVSESFSASGNILLLSGLAGDPVPLLELVESAMFAGNVPVLYEPCRPWVGVSGLESGVGVWEHYERVNRSAGSLGAQVAVSFGEAVEKLIRARAEILEY